MEEEVGATATTEVAVRPPALAVTVMLRDELSPAVLSVAMARPLMSVTPWVTTRPPESEVKETGTPAINRLLASRAMAVTVAVAEPLDGIVAELAVIVSALTGLEEAAPPTETVTVDVNVPARAVTVILRGVLLPPVVRLAKATPFGPVVVDPALNAPDEAVSVTGTPATTMLLLSSTRAWIAAVTEPSAGIEAALAVRVNEAGVVDEDVAPTATTTVEVKPPAWAVTVMLRGVPSPPVVSCAVATPSAPVAVVPTLNAPEEVERVTGTLPITTLLPSSTRALISALAEPSAGIDAMLEVRVSAAGVRVVPPLPPVPPPPDPPWNAFSPATAGSERQSQQG